MTCDGCGAEGVLCETVDGEVSDGQGGLILHPALEPEAQAIRFLEILLPGKSDGSSLHFTYCNACAEIEVTT